MITNNNRTALEEQFKKECKIINLRYEYPGFTGNEDWAIFSDLSGKAFWQKYKSVARQYVPFVILPVEQVKVFEEYHRVEDKYRKRSLRNNDIFGCEDTFSSQFHKELCSYDEFSYERKERIEKEQYKDWQIAMVKEGMEQLTDTQKRRLKAVYFGNKTLRQVAAEEGVNFTKIDKSINQALKKLKKFLETGGTNPDLYPNE